MIVAPDYVAETAGVVTTVNPYPGMPLMAVLVPAAAIEQTLCGDLSARTVSLPTNVLPQGARLVGILDGSAARYLRETRSVAYILTHDSFPVVPHGGAIPTLTPAYRTEPRHSSQE